MKKKFNDDNPKYLDLSNEDICKKRSKGILIKELRTFKEKDVLKAYINPAQPFVEQNKKFSIFDSLE
jgi:hypothetical protein